MTEHTPNPHAHDDALDLATLIRCAADDALSVPQAEALLRHLEAHPEDRARIEFEKSLREATATAMDTGPAPSALRESVEAMLAPGGLPGTVGPGETTNRSFWRRTFAPIAIAAMVLLAFGATLYLNTTGGPSAPAVADGGLDARVVNWVEREHKKCADSETYREHKLSVTEVADVSARTERDLGAAPRRIQLDDAGYTFAGYGPCHIPGGGPSGQLVYTPNSGKGEPISLFVQRDDGQFDAVAGASDCIRSVIERKQVSNGEGGEDQIYIWRADGLIYYLVTSRNNEAMPCLKSLGAPDNQISL